MRYNVYLKKMNKLTRMDLGLDVEGYKDYVVGGKIPEFTWLWLGILSSVSISILLTYNARLSKIVLVILILMVILCCGLFEYFVIHYDFD